MMVMIIVQIVIKMRTGSGKRTRTTKLTMHPFAADSIIMIMKRISRAPIYRTRWEYRALYNPSNTHTHTHTHTHTDARAAGGGGWGWGGGGTDD